MLIGVEYAYYFSFHPLTSIQEVLHDKFSLNVPFNTGLECPVFHSESKTTDLVLASLLPVSIR